MSSHHSPQKSKKPSAADKIQRQNMLEKERRLKPGECHKYIRVQIDPGIVQEFKDIGSKVTSILSQNNFKYEIRSQKIPRTILWERSDQQFLTNNDDKVFLSDKFQLENQMLLIMHAENLIESIQMESLNHIIEDVKLKYNDDICITLLIFGLRKFCKAHKTGVGRRQIEESLTEIQIEYNCCHRLLETPDEVAEIVEQFSKAIAEIPFKEHKNEVYEGIGTFLENDNKSCVTVDGIAGLSRLWQQHLTRIPNVTLEIAEAIMNKYPTPKSLFDAYECETDPSKLLENLKIRRAGDVLSAVRRIGPEISRKVYKFYTSQEPDEIL